MQYNVGVPQPKEAIRLATGKEHAAWEKYNTVQVKMKLNNNTDADIIRFLQELNGSKQGYLKRLIRDDMERKSEQDNGTGPVHREPVNEEQTWILQNWESQHDAQHHSESTGSTR